MNAFPLLCYSSVELSGSETRAAPDAAGGREAAQRAQRAAVGGPARVAPALARRLRRTRVRRLRERQSTARSSHVSLFPIVSPHNVPTSFTLESSLHYSMWLYCYWAYSAGTRSGISDRISSIGEYSLALISLEQFDI